MSFYGETFMMNFQFKHLITLAVLGLLTTSQARANLLLNGDFELGTIANANAITNWTPPCQ